MIQKRYEGKAKIVEPLPGREGVVRIRFKDDATAGNGAKKDRFAGKGACCARISTLMFEYLRDEGLASHFLEGESETTLLAKAVDIVPLEVVVRNVAAGSLCKRTGLAKGTAFAMPIVEFYLKDDALGDPLLNRDHIRALGLVADDDLDRMRDQALFVNQRLTRLCERMGLRLVDFKLEFGRAGDALVLADEISPDTCRFWDGDRSLDKDVFRRGDGSPVDGYREFLRRLEDAIGREVAR